MQLHTTPEVRALGLRHPRVWRLRSEEPLLSAPGLTADQVSSLYDPATPVPSGYRTLLEALGHPGVVPAGERLRELLVTRGWRSHGAVIDAVNSATLRHGAGIGLHRLPDDEGRDLLVARAAGTERITPAFSSKSRPVPAGDLVYGRSGSSPSARSPRWPRCTCCATGRARTRNSGCAPTCLPPSWRAAPGRRRRRPAWAWPEARPACWPLP